MALPPILRRPLEALGLLDPPILEGSPQSDDAPPTVGGMVTQSTFATWIPEAWMNAIAENEDTVLRRDGGQGLKVFDALLDDDVAFSALQQRRMAITARDWEVAPGDPDDPRSVLAADDLRAMLKAVGWDRVTGAMHYGVWYGYAVAENIYEMRDHDGRMIVWLSDVVVPDRGWFGFSLKGELRMTTAGVATVEGARLPDNKFWSIRTGASHDFAFYGLGLAHWAYWPIFFKRSALKFWALFLEKFGQPTVAIEFTEAQKNDKAEKANLMQAGIAIGRDSVVLLPEGTIKEDRLKLIEAQRSGTGASSYNDFVGLQDDALIRVILGQVGTMKATPGGLGGDGQASKDEGVKGEIVKSDSDMISEAFNRGPARWLTRWNHGPDVAPPTVYRVLDDAEDLNTIADRDVALNGIGIKRTEDSIRDVYGEGYEVDRMSEADKAAQETERLKMAAQAKGGAVPAANDNTAKRAKIMQFAAQGSDKPFSPLYVSRKLTPKSARDVIAWAKSQGITTTVPAEDMHCTILYSKAAVDWFDMAGEGWDGESARIEAGGARFVERFGHGEADAPVVLRFASPMFRYRHDSMIERGASSDYPDYKPHITISYDAPDLDLAKVEPFVGELNFGPEIFEPIKSDEFEAGMFEFTAAEEEAVARLVAALVDDTSPVFAAMADEMRDALQGVTTVEGARIAILSAVEKYDTGTLAKRLGLAFASERVAALVGCADDVTP